MKYTVITVDAPATTANLGAGYDCLALGLDWWNEFQVVVRTDGSPVEPLDELAIDWAAHGEQDNLISSRVRNVFVLSFRATLKYLVEATGLQVPPMNMFFGAKVNLPIERGLGSSSSACVAGAVAALEFLKSHRGVADVSRGLERYRGVALYNDDERRDLLASLARPLDTCPDNICAALTGGLTSVYVDRGASSLGLAQELHFFRERVSDPSLRCVATIFDHGISTTEARKALEKTDYRIEDVAQNIARGRCLPIALRTGRYDLLAELADDWLHQHQRAKLYPVDPSRIMEAAIDAGAYCSFVSGAGSTIASLTDESTVDNVSRAVEERYLELLEDIPEPKMNWRIVENRVLEISNAGAESRAKGCVVYRSGLPGVMPSERLANAVEEWCKRLDASSAPYVPLEGEVAFSEVAPKTITEISVSSSDRPPRVFLSYATDDHAVVDRVAAALKAFGVDIFFAKLELKPGDSLIDRVNSALRASDTLVVALSPRSIRSHWVMGELNAGLAAQLAGEDVRIVPLILAHCDIPPLLRSTLYVDVSVDFDAGLIQLIQLLKAPRVDLTGSRG